VQRELRRLAHGADEQQDADEAHHGPIRSRNHLQGAARLVGRGGEFWPLWRKLALTILPIALGYHFAHYLTSALVNLQYLLAALNDPLETGAALLGLHHFHVTTSFFNQWHTVRAIWLTQAGSIVLAHMLAIVLSHAIALRAFGSHRTATLSQAPVAGFMVLYTWFGLWLLASPLAL